MSPRNKIVAGRRSPSLVRCRSGGGRLAAMLIVCCLIGPILSGCAAHKQIQYFAATDQLTGVTNYYRLTVSGSGLFGVDYHLQAGYFSAAAVDILRGSMPKIPVLDLPIEQLEVYDRLTSQFFAALVQEIKRIHKVTDLEAIFVATLSRKNNADDKVLQLTKESEQLDADIKVKQELLKRSEEKRGTKETEEKEACANYKALKETAEATTNDLKAAREEQKSPPEGIEALEEMIRKHDKAKQEVDATETAAAKAEQEGADTAEELRTKADEAASIAEGLREDAEKAKTDRDEKLADKKKLDETKISELQARVETELEALAPCDKIKVENEALGRLIDSRRTDIQNDSRRLVEIEKKIPRLKASAKQAGELLTLIAEKNKDRDVADWTVDKDTDPLTEDDILRMARMIWFGSLSSSDLASIGMTGHTNPFQFRKLVYWATAQNIDLNQFAGEIDAILDNATSIAMSFKKLAEQRKAEKKARGSALEKVLPGLLGLAAGDKTEAIKGLMELINPDTGGGSSGADMNALIDLFMRKNEEASSSENGE